MLFRYYTLYILSCLVNECQTVLYMLGKAILTIADFNIQWFRPEQGTSDLEKTTPPGELEMSSTGWPIKIKPHRNSCTKGCIKWELHNYRISYLL